MHERPLPRLFVDQPLGQGQNLALDKAAGHYLTRVLRLKKGAAFLVFNGRDGEWRAAITSDQKSASAQILVEERPQGIAPDLHYLFAPIKGARLDFVAQKAVEMGVSAVHPVLTERTVVRKVNEERLRKNAVEAAEQCGILTIPSINTPLPLTEILAAWDDRRKLVFCDESAALDKAAEKLGPLKGKPLAVLIGPEGGFTPAERQQILALPFVTSLSLGPRILRADTAAVAALALIEACCR